MRRLSLVSCFVVLSLLVMSVPSQASRRGGDFRRFEPYRLLFSTEQNQQLDALLAKAKPELLPLYKQLHTERLKLRQMVRSEETKDADLKAMTLKMADIEYEILIRRAQLIRAIRKIATPEQLAKIDALEAKRLKQQQKFLERLEKLPPQGDDN